MCVLDGGSASYVLRENVATGNWIFVGECYLHGMVDGQAVEDDPEIQEFVIKG